MFADLDGSLIDNFLYLPYEGTWTAHVHIVA